MGNEIRQRSRTGRYRFAIGLTFFAYLAWNLLAWNGQPARETFDSYRYLGDWGLDFVAIFEPLNGGIATSFVYALAPDPTLISLVQVLVSTAVWSLLALAVLQRLNGLWIGWLLAVAVLVVSMQSVFWSSHFAVGAESLVFSAAVAWLASVVWLTTQRAPGTVGIAATLAALLLVAVTRPQAMLALIPIQIILLIWWSRREHSPRALAYAIPALLPVAAFAAYRVWQVSQHDRWAFRYTLHNLVDKPPSFRTYALERMPPCDAIPNALNGPAPWNDVLALEGTLIGQCPDTYLWFQSGATSVWTWVPAMPLETLRNFVDVMPSLQLIRWNEFIALPQVVDDWIIPNANPWVFTLGCIVAGVALALVGAQRPRVTLLSVLGTVIAAGCVIGYVLLVWAADGVDHGRHVFPFLPMAGVAALILPSALAGPRRQ